MKLARRATGSTNKGKNWLIENVAGIGPLFAAEVAMWKGKLPDGIKRLLERVRSHSSYGWIYSSRPLSVILEQADLSLLRKAKLSPIELESLGKSYSHKTFPGILEAMIGTPATMASDITLAPPS